nr:MAG TPA: hypothetical protein [Caudoviricetes sp.]
MKSFRSQYHFLFFKIFAIKNNSRNLLTFH